MVSFDKLLFLFHSGSHGREEHVSNGWNSCLEAKINAVINGLRTNNSALLGVQLEPSNDARGGVGLNAFEMLSINNDVAWNVIGSLSLETNDLSDKHFLVHGNGFFFDRLDESLVFLSAPDEDLAFHQLDETL